MTEQTTTLEPVDVSDLDLLDDDVRHAQCTACFPRVLPPLTPFPALCGATGMTLTGVGADTIPPNACRACLDVWTDPCRRCGA